MPPPLDSSIILSIFLITHQEGKFSFFFLYSIFLLMVPELEKPRVTEIQVRMDCNGCVQKIKKALHGINGIYDLYIDFPQQKLTIIGWADPEKIVKAIKKTRKIATICSHSEPTQETPPPTEPAPQEGSTNTNETPPPPNETANPPPPEAAPPPEQAPPAEPPRDQPPQENQPPEPQPSPVDPGQPVASGPKDVGEVHVIYHHPPDYGYRYSYGHHGYNGYWNKYHYGHGHPQEGPVPVSPVPQQQPPPPPPPPQQQPQPQPQPQPQLQPLPQPQLQPQPQPVYVTHSYNMYRPSPYVTEYAEYARTPARPHAHYYSRTDRMYNNYEQDQNQYYYYTNGSSSSSNGNITSIFSDENPNACRIV